METATVTLSDFLLARIAEDKVGALQIGEAVRWEDRRGEVFAVAGMSWRRVVEVDEANGVSTIAAEHIARWDPARVLAECEKNKRIVDIANAQIGLGRQARGWDNWEDMATQTLHALAAPYADHPHYRDEWRP